jgi:hypothetical protein
METSCLEEWPPEYCWSGEDCYLGCSSYRFCHPAGATGLVLEGVETPGEVVEGVTTLMTAGNCRPDGLTYFVKEEASGECWVWGHDVGYYASRGCTEL